MSGGSIRRTHVFRLILLNQSVASLAHTGACRPTDANAAGMLAFRDDALVARSTSLDAKPVIALWMTVNLICLLVTLKSQGLQCLSWPRSRRPMFFTPRQLVIAWCPCSN